jgi:hypothetical protein
VREGGVAGGRVACGCRRASTAVKWERQGNLKRGDERRNERQKNERHLETSTMASTSPLSTMLFAIFVVIIIAALVPSQCDAFSTGRSGSTGGVISGNCGRSRCKGVGNLQMIDSSGDAGIEEVPLDDDTLLPPPVITATEDDDDEEDNQASSFSSTVFTATPITITPTSNFVASSRTTTSSTQEQNKVNSATLRFNNRLNQLAKNWDESTAPKVEALLLDALEKYQLYLDKEEEEGQGESTTSSSTKKNNMIIPNTISFTNAITAWARCTRKDSAKRAQALLDQMLHLYSSDNNSDGKWDHIKPNKISYNSVITAWARSNERGSARQAEELLRNMYDFYNNESGLDPNCKPDARSFNAVINAVARSRDKNCADRAKFLLDEMGRLYNEGDDDLLPDALTFGAIINAYANSLEPGSSDKAAQLLMHMESLYSMGFEQAKPTTFVYNACMNAFAKDPLICVIDEMRQQQAEGGGNSTSLLNRAEKAEQLLDSMEKRYNQEKDWRIKPDIISYSTVINAHANSGTCTAGVNADGILRRMLHRYLMGDTKCRPNAIVFTAAIKAHSTSINATLSELDDLEDKESRVQKLEQIKASAKRCEDLLQELCLLGLGFGNDSSMKPSSVTFELVIGALTLAEEWGAVKRITALREEGMHQRD